MPKTEQDATETTAAAPVQLGEPADYPMPLDEYCARRSATDRRVELIGAFHHDERHHGRLKDTTAAYDERLGVFGNRVTA